MLPGDPGCRLHENPKELASENGQNKSESTWKLLKLELKGVIFVHDTSVF